jgi:hypothetical protein
MLNRFIRGSIPIFALILTSGRAFSENEIFDALTQRGLEIAPQEVVKLSQPILADDAPPEQRNAIQILTADRYDWETFTRNSINSPFLLKINGGENDSNRVGRQVDLYFIAYGPLGKLKSDNYLQEQLGIASSESHSGESGSARVLTGDDIKKRGLLTATNEDERWVAVESAFLGKVRINLTTHNQRTSTADSVLLASVADPRFNRDPEFPNMWRPIVVDDAGNRQLGPPQPYASLGSYMKATQLTEPPGALFIEYHVVFAEPHDWFHGANLLRSKLPIVAQDMVRKIRRNLNAH